ncbi:MAG: ABC transporter ATP-binding protein [Chloroflexota bacterium]
MKHVLRYAWQGWQSHKLTGVLIIGLISADKLFWLYFSYELKEVIDQIGQTTAMSRFLLVLLLIFPLITAANILADRVTASVRIKMANDIRVKMFDHLQSLSLNFFKHSQTGDIVTRFTSDLDSIERVISDRALNAMMSVIAVTLYLTFLTYLNWYLTLLTLFILLLLLPLTRWIAPRLITAWYNVRQTEAQIANIIQENVKAQPVIKGFGLEHHMSDIFRQRLNGFADRYIEAFFINSLTTKTIILLVMYVVLVIAYSGLLLVNFGLTSAGAVVAFLGLLVIFAKELLGLSNQLEYIFRAAGSICRIDDLFQQTPQVRDAKIVKPFPTPQKNLRLNQVSFSYTTNNYELNNVDLTIPVGQYTAVVGPSGAGKSTLLNLLVRFYDVRQGQITIDNQDIRQISQEALRDHIGIVFQDSFLFDATIRENICLFDANATIRDVQAAAKAAEIHDFIMSLPQGYETQVGEAGGRLSGGQRQRIAIARALFQNPPILLLDEVTASLDTEVAAAINQTLQTLAENRTIIAVTHDLKQAARADSIIVLDAGRCVEIGPHQALLTNQDLYAQLWHKQQGYSVPSHDLRRLSIPEGRGHKIMNYG